MIRDALLTFRTFLGELRWEDVIVGHDFGFLDPAQIQAWSEHRFPSAPGSLLHAGDPRDFEARLWTACAEATGRTPRPGSARWAEAQDRWRLAFLREALATESTLPQLAQRVERLYEQVGCPEDMLGMLRPSQSWSGLPARLDTRALADFLRRFDPCPAPVA
ncbi:MAG TPA: hypothetical protein VF768_12365 [Holophagaceae bacterium]